MNLLQFSTYWRKSDFFGRSSFLFRQAGYLFNAVFLWLFLKHKNIEPELWYYFTLALSVLLPYLLFVYYVRNDNDKGVGIRQNMADFLMIGWYVGFIQLTYIPSTIFILGLISNYVAARGFHKFYRLLLIGVGYALTLPILGFAINHENIALLTNLALIYALVHFVTTAYISYQFSKSVQLVSRKLFDQQKEILLQSEELQALNESLKSLNMHLEEKVFERTEELAAKNEKLAEYTFINGHQLRAPVATMLGLVQLLDYENSSAEKEEIINKIKHEVHLLNITTKEIRLKLETDQLINTELRIVEKAHAKI